MIRKIKNLKWVQNVIEFQRREKQVEISTHAAASAFFLFLSLFPLLSFLLMLVPILPISEEEYVDFLVKLFPPDFSGFVRKLISDIFSQGSPGITIISIVAGLWSAAKGIAAIRKALNKIYHAKEDKNFLINRVFGALYTLIFVALLLGLVLINLLGHQVLEALVNQWPDFKSVADFLLSIRGLVTFVLALGMMLFLYKLPKGKQPVLYQLPGAIFSAFTWGVLAQLFSLYIRFTMSKSYMYGSLTSIILMLFWMYMLVTIIFLGGQINRFFAEYVWPEKLKLAQEKKRRKKETREKKTESNDHE